MASKNGEASEDLLDIPDEVSAELLGLARETIRAQIAHDITAEKRLAPLRAKRRELTSKIPKFWITTLTNTGALQIILVHREDLAALSYLTDLWIERDPVEPRAYTLEFHFSENPYFSDSVLKKEFKYVPAPPEDASEVPSSTPGEDGVSDAMVDFKWDKDVKPQAIKINWKSEAKDITKLYPRKVEDDDPEDIIDAGSFFNFFQYPDDPDNLSSTFEEDIYPHAVEYFLGNGPNPKSEEDETDEEEEDEDEDGSSVDLEHPKKKLKRAL